MKGMLPGPFWEFPSPSATLSFHQNGPINCQKWVSYTDGDDDGNIVKFMNPFHMNYSFIFYT